MDSITKALKALIDETATRAAERAVSKLAPRLRVDERDRPSKAYLTNAEAQEYLGLSKATLARYRADGTLLFSKVGQNVYYRLDAIEALLDRNTVGGDGATSAKDLASIPTLG